MIEAFKSDTYDDTFTYEEYMYDTFEELSPEENKGEATAELFTEDMESLANNAKKINKIF